MDRMCERPNRRRAGVTARNGGRVGRDRGAATRHDETHERAKRRGDRAVSEHEIAAGGVHAIVSATGAGLRALRRGGVNLTETWAPGTRPPLSAGLVLFPWPNRVRDGRWGLRRAEPPAGDQRAGVPQRQPRPGAPRRLAARRGGGRLRRAVGRRRDRAGLAVPAAPHVVRHEVDGEGLTVTHTVTNTGTRRAPFGLGVHSFLRAGDAPLDTCTVTVPAARTLPIERERKPAVGSGRTRQRRARPPCRPGVGRRLAGQPVHRPRPGRRRSGPRRAGGARRHPRDAVGVTRAGLAAGVHRRPRPRAGLPRAGSGPGGRADELPARRPSPPAMTSSSWNRGGTWRARWGITGELP